MGEDKAWTYLGAEEGNIPQQIISRHLQTNNCLNIFVKGESSKEQGQFLDIFGGGGGQYSSTNRIKAFSNKQMP